MKKADRLLAAMLLAGAAAGSFGQGGDPKVSLMQTLSAQFVPTKFTADKSGIVAPGATAAVLKEGLLVYSISVPVPPVSVYKRDKDKFTQGLLDMMAVDLADGLGRAGGSSSIPKRTVNAGEKVWVSGFGSTKDSLLVQVITDADDQGRYFANIKFPIPKGSTPAPDDAVKMISEALEVQQAQPPPEVVVDRPPPPPPPTPQYQEILPPPLPPVSTRTVTLGMKKGQVSEAFGEPQKTLAVGAREIFVYTDPKMKITFINGKVSNVE
jgi:hypothetical protein